MGRFERCFKGNRNRESKGKENLSIRLHAFLVLYNVTTGLPAKHIKNIMILIQEVKRNIVLRRFKRETYIRLRGYHFWETEAACTLVHHI